MEKGGISMKGLLPYLVPLTLLAVCTSCQATGAGVATVPAPPASPTAQLASPSPAVATPAPVASSAEAITAAQVEANPELFRDRLVRIRGRGLTVATVPQCPGYVGFDKRVRFIDAEGKLLFAVDRLPASVRRSYTEPRLFEGYVRVFTGETGCPGQTKVESFPYFEVVGVSESG